MHEGSPSVGPARQKTSNYRFQNAIRLRLGPLDFFVPGSVSQVCERTYGTIKMGDAMVSLIVGYSKALAASPS
jgi:hypothetical protein